MKTTNISARGERRTFVIAESSTLRLAHTTSRSRTASTLSLEKEAKKKKKMNHGCSFPRYDSSEIVLSLILRRA